MKFQKAAAYILLLRSPHQKPLEKSSKSIESVESQSFTNHTIKSQKILSSDNLSRRSNVKWKSFSIPFECLFASISADRRWGHWSSDSRRDLYDIIYGLLFISDVKPLFACIDGLQYVPVLDNWPTSDINQSSSLLSANIYSVLVSAIFLEKKDYTQCPIRSSSSSMYKWYFFSRHALYIYNLVKRSAR